MARPPIAKKLVEVAEAEGADAVSHGCTGKGNDQVRFELTVMALNPKLKVIAPWREWEIRSREDAIHYAQKHNVPISHTEKDIYSRDSNIFHLSHEGGVLENAWNEPEEKMYQLSVSPEKAPNEPEYIEIGFEKGRPVSVNGEALSGVKIFTHLNAVGGKHGIDRADIVENRLDIMYFWRADPFVEIGAPEASPAKAAAAAAGVLLNVDEFAAAFFKRGAIKTTLLTTTNIQPAERDRLKTWWSRVTGAAKAWTTDIVNADTVKPVVIGEGLESLQNNDLTESKRVDIAAALRIPYSVLFSNASNRATAEQDDLHLYSKTIIPECRFIEGVLNDQLFTQAGYKFSFTPENLDVFQEDENARAASLEKLIAALADPEKFLLAADILGYEINPDTKLRIEAMVAKKEERREAMAEIAAQAPAQQPPAFGQNGGQPQPMQQQKEMPPDMRALDLEKWRMKALKRVKSGRGMAFQFTSDNLDPVLMAGIGGALEEATSEDEVRAVFDSALIGYP